MVTYINIDVSIEDHILTDSENSCRKCQYYVWSKSSSSQTLPIVSSKSSLGMWGFSNATINATHNRLLHLLQL